MDETVTIPCNVGRSPLEVGGEIRVKHEEPGRQWYAAGLNDCDQDFPQAQGFWVVKEEFSEAGRLATPRTGEVVNTLLAELRSLRGQLDACTCEAGDGSEPVAPSSLDHN